MSEREENWKRYVKLREIDVALDEAMQRERDTEILIHLTRASILVNKAAVSCLQREIDE